MAPLKIKNKVLLLIDWDNLFLCLSNKLGPANAHISARLDYLHEWIKKNIGELLGNAGFVFAPEHLASHHRQLCQKLHLKTIICPKIDKQDTVDENIIWFAKLFSRHPEIKYVCLVSGDGDYFDALRELKLSGIKVAVVLPTVQSFSLTNDIASLADVGPKNRRMLLIMERISNPNLS